MLLGQGVCCSFLSTGIDGARNAAVLVSHQAEISSVEISSKSKKQTSKMQGWVLGKLSKLDRGEQCPNQQGMFLISFHSFQL